MGQARGRQADLRVAKALADLTQDAIAADANVVKFDLCVTAGRIAVHGVEDAVDREAGRIQGVRAGKVLKKARAALR
jgi:hypothetical protein